MFGAEVRVGPCKSALWAHDGPALVTYIGYQTATSKESAMTLVQAVNELAPVSTAKKKVMDTSAPDAEAIVIGAGPAGLACAAALRKIGKSVVVLEQADKVGSSWRRHYDRLRLHTPKRNSGLPGLPMPGRYSNYVSRDEFIAYLEQYAEHLRIAPRFGARVVGVKRRERWIVETETASLTADNVIFATGIAGSPFRPRWPGIESFPGPVLHSSEYVNAKPFAARGVLVVGLGNSGGEIAIGPASSGRGRARFR